VHAFQKPAVIKPKVVPLKKPVGKLTAKHAFRDMLIVPAKEEGFKRVFLGENRWRAVRIARKYLSQLRYVCAYQTAPISAITYWAEVEKIEPYGDKGKYQLFFKGKAQKLSRPLLNENLPRGFMQGMMYTNYEIFKKSRNLKELFV
jgi:hypothetical protein